ncbi:AAA family ATPase [Alkalibacillus aidingensis]|uniref:AAA family ATPase n=1 Tax=Alkalibacillus aidingensis TaxID=2747607 RepID=UPI001660B0E0|nr:AAA family ATPase [Alkalibacillus aidingensis]
MHFKRLEIVAFGKWHQQTIELTDGFNYIYGANESGKSSLRMFITYVLFGLSAQNREQYRSKIDGQIGGRVVIEKDGEDWVIERFAHHNRGKRIAYYQGEPVDDKAINQVLQHIDLFLFEAIFSFQDRDLHAIRHKHSDDIGKVLFNLGLTGSDQVVAIEKELTKKSEGLFKKQGRKPPINEKLNELKSLTEEIERVDQREKQHHGLYQDVKRLEREMVLLKEEEKRLDTSIRNAQLLLQAKSSIVQFQQLSHEMNELLTESHLTEAMIERYQEVKEMRQEFDEKARVLISKLDHVKQEEEDLRKASKQEVLPFSLDEVEQWVFDLERQYERNRELNEQLKKLQNSLDEQLKDTNLYTNKDELSALELSQYTKQSWQRLAQEIKANAEKLSELQSKKRVKLTELQELSEKQTSMEQQMLSEERRITLTDQLEQLKQRQARQSLEKQMQSQSEAQQKQLSRLNHWMSNLKWGISTLSIVAITIYVLYVSSGSSSDYLWLSGLMGGGLLAFILFHFQSRSIKKELNKLKKTSDYYKEEEDLTRKVMEIERLLEKEQQDQQQLNELKMKMDYLHADLRENEAERLRLEEKLDQLETERVSEVQQFPFLESFDLDQWSDIYQLLVDAQNYMAKISDIEVEIAEVERVSDHLEDQLKRFLSYYVSEGELYRSKVSIEMVRHYIKYERDLAEKQYHQNQWRQQLEQELKELKLAYEPYEQDLNQLLQETNFENEEILRQAIVDFETYQEKDRAKQQHYQVVNEIFNEQTDHVLKKSYDWIEIEQRLRQDEDNRIGVLDQLENKRQVQADLTATIKQLEEDGRLSNLIHDQAVLEGEIMSLAKEWAVYQTAKGVLQDTKARYQYEYLPAVLEYTRKVFHNVTRGRYVEVGFSKEQSLRVCQSNGEWFDVKQLSEGTADQLYVSLRLALNEALTHTTGFPFILDDAFVHFDDMRKSLMIDELLEKAKEQQLIYFSCESYPFTESTINVVPIEEYGKAQL